VLRKLGTAAILVAGLFFLLLALGQNLQLLAARELVAAGTRAEATVTAMGAPRRSTAYRYTYSYRVGGTEHVRADRSIPYGQRESLKPGTKIEVWYDPKRPEVATSAAELAEHESVPNRLFLPLIGAVLLGWGLARILRRPTAPGSRGSR